MKPKLDDDYINANPRNKRPMLILPVDPKKIPAHLMAEVSKRKRLLTRNSKCPCGSGKRFKRCCMLKAKGKHE